MIRWFLMELIGLYRAASASLVPGACRFEPSCSRYALESLETFETTAALSLIARRLARCQPFHPGGFDPVPQSLRTSTR